ncbi:exoribonuclease II [Achromatium sp. WMS2]|nr:exoribonuclease II [Achromatium sp. WMS2]
MNLPVDSLVLYRAHPARVLSVGEKIEIELDGGANKKVRPKDIMLIHPGPLHNLKDLVPIAGDIEDAWAILENETTNLTDLAELIYTEFTPITAWSTWQFVADGLLFAGNPESIQARPGIEVDKIRNERIAKETTRKDWLDFIERLRNDSSLPGDRERLQEVEAVALGKSNHSRILETLGKPVSKESAHRLLIAVGYWPPDYNPYPSRYDINLKEPVFVLPKLPSEKRVDLTYLAAYAIDNEGSTDPDDAISLDGDRLWVHVADVAAIVTPDSEMDLEARSRGANLYVPEGIIPILPNAVTHNLGLGLTKLSPALSFGIRLAANGNTELEIQPSWIKVQRLSYQQAEQQLTQEPLASIQSFIAKFRAKRQVQGSININLPEVNIKLRDGLVHIQPFEPLQSRELVADAMLLAGEAVARYCQQLSLPIPYVVQQPPEKVEHPVDLAGMWSYRRLLRPSSLSIEPGPHAGLGLELYTRATSPLRRYSDLLVHQQLRAYLSGNKLIDDKSMLERYEQGEMGGIRVRRAERASNNHWKLVWLKQHPLWRGEAVVVEQFNDRFVTIIPELALEAKVRIAGGASLNSHVKLKLRDVDIPNLACYFSVRS